MIAGKSAGEVMGGGEGIAVYCTYMYMRMIDVDDYIIIIRTT